MYVCRVSTLRDYKRLFLSRNCLRINQTGWNTMSDYLVAIHDKKIQDMIYSFWQLNSFFFLFHIQKSTKKDKHWSVSYNILRNLPIDYRSMCIPDTTRCAPVIFKMWFLVAFHRVVPCYCLQFCRDCVRWTKRIKGPREFKIPMPVFNSFIWRERNT